MVRLGTCETVITFDVGNNSSPRDVNFADLCKVFHAFHACRRAHTAGSLRTVSGNFLCSSGDAVTVAGSFPLQLEEKLGDKRLRDTEWGEDSLNMPAVRSHSYNAS